MREMRKNKRLSAALGMGAVLVASTLQAAERPNILFIFSDDHALRTISAYAGDEAINSTPNIDSIARDGAIFTESFCTNSICQPSRASILTGKHSHKNGVLTNGSPWNNQQQVFTRLMSGSGYQTAMIGKWHMHPLPSTEFDYHCTLVGNGGQGRYYNPEFMKFDGTPETVEGYSTDVITDKSLKWLDGRDKDKPFMLMTQFKSPHTNVMPAIRHLDMFKGEKIPVPDSYHNNNKTRSEYLAKTWMKMSGMKAPDVLKTGPAKGDYKLPDKNDPKAVRKAQRDGIPKFYAEMTPEQLKAWHAHYDPINAEYGRRLAAGDMTQKEKDEFPYQRYMQDYLRCVAAVDENVGRLLKYLEDNGLAENTIVIYSSDQGFLLGENGWTDKRIADDVTMKMPFVIRWPKVIKPGQRPETLIQNIDYAPTFLEAAGVEIPEDIQGRSLIPVLKGKTPKDWRKSIYYSYHHAGAYNLPKIESVRGGRYKLIRYYQHPKLKLGEQWELFDLEKDPKEQKNLSNNPEYASVIKKMKKELQQLRDQYEVQTK